MEETEFYVTLPSNVDVKGNRSCSFLTRLPERLNVAGYECGLAEILYPETYDNLSERPRYTIQRQDGTSTSYQIREGTYTSMKEFVNLLTTAQTSSFGQSSASLSGQLNQNGSKDGTKAPGQATKSSKEIGAGDSTTSNKASAKKDEDPTRPLVSFVYSETSKRVYIEVDTKRVNRLELSEQLAYILGFRSATLTDSAFGQYAPNLHNNISTVFVYTDIIYPQIVGGKRSQLLRVIPTSAGSHGTMVKHTFDNIFYFPLLSTTIDSIQITLASELGVEIPYNYGTVVVVLKFRPMRSN